MFRRHVLARYRLYSRRTRRYVLHNILHADDPPHKLALGIALAMFVTFTPTVGLQMVLVFFLAWLLRGNKVVGVPLVWLSNPFTIPPIFYFNYWVGAIALGGDLKGFEWFVETVQAAEGRAADATWWGDGWWLRVSAYFQMLLDIAVPLWFGSILVATALAVPTYYICYWTICWYRMKRWGQLIPPLALEAAAISHLPRADDDRSAPEGSPSAESADDDATNGHSPNGEPANGDPTEDGAEESPAEKASAEANVES
jgi:uncharacterized protein (DUF2062 family)